MRKLIVLLVVIAALGAGYYVYWHKMAEDFKLMAGQFVENINTLEKPLTKDLPAIKYEAIEVTGFPFSMVIEMTKPVVSIPVSALLVSLPSQKTMATTPAPYEWVEEMSWAEKATLTRNVMGDHYTFTFNGDRIEKALINRVARHTFVVSSSAPTVLHLAVERPAGSMPWTIQPIFSDPETFMHTFRSFSENVKSMTITDANGNVPLMSSEAFSLSLANEMAEGKNHKLVFQVDADKMKATPAFDKVVDDYMLMTRTLTGKAGEPASPSISSEAGEQDMKIDVRYDGPIDPSEMKDPGTSLHFDINSFDFHNALSDMTLQTHLAFVPQGNDRAISLALHEKMKVTDRYDQVMTKQLVSMLADMSKDPSVASKPDPFTHALLSSPPDQVVAKLYPQLHTLGQTSLDIDLNVKVPNEGSSFMSRSSATLDDFDILTQLYGIKLKGSTIKTGPNTKPSGDLSITCISCDALVTDLGDYAMRVESIFDQAAQPPKPPFLSKDLIDATKQFLHGIAENGNAADLVIHFVMKETGSFSISGKQIPEVLALYMGTIGAHMPHPAIPPAQ